MINLGYPSFVVIDNKKYYVNTSYKYGLACFACMNDNDISDIERAYGIIGLLYIEAPEDSSKAVEVAIKYLRCGKEPKPNVYASGSGSQPRPDMDYVLDIDYIKSSFIYDYKIDLDKEDMHWWKFCNLINGLSEKCMLSRVRDIRNYDLNSIKDYKSKIKMQRAQEEVALPQRLSIEEQNIIDEFEELFK